MVELKNVTVRRRDQTILDDVSFHVYSGDTAVILGPSGAGKSSVLKVILGIWPVNSGQVLIDGKEMRALSKGDSAVKRTMMAMVFQSNALFDSINVAENVGFFLRERDRYSEQFIKNRVDECLEIVNLEGTQKLLPEELSEGMKKRVAIARAIAIEPEIILYDEPTTGLDPVNSRIVVELIKKLKSAQTTFLVVTHILADAAALGDTFSFINKGRLLLSGTLGDLMGSANPEIIHFFETYNPNTK